MITRNAYAKINLGLEVIGRRDDGYHDIVSVMQLVDLHDTLTFTEDNEAIWVECDNSALAAEGKNNLVWRAARLLQQTTRVEKGCTIDLKKRIPVAGGLAGGSSDAAATLLGLSELWGLDMPHEKLRNLAGMLGSDVPFFLDGPTALVEGRGDRVTPVPPPPPGLALLVCEPFNVDRKTERLYGSLEYHDFTKGIITRQLVAALRRGEFPASSLLYNTFERAAYRVFDGLDDVRQRIVRAGGDDVRLSGSGPTLYVLFPEADQERAEQIYEDLKSGGTRAYLTKLLTE